MEIDYASPEIGKTLATNVITRLISGCETYTLNTEIGEWLYTTGTSGLSLIYIKSDFDGATQGIYAGIYIEKKLMELSERRNEIQREVQTNVSLFDAYLAGSKVEQIEKITTSTTDHGATYYNLVKKIYDIDKEVDLETLADSIACYFRRLKASLRGSNQLYGIIGEFKSQNVIFCGPPGTGKTYSLQEEMEKYQDRRKFITFHQSYGYEDFVEGYRPADPPKKSSAAEADKTPDLGPQYVRKDGVFKAVCDEAKKNPNQSYALLIDEINRGNISKIFGELITLIEDDKRQHCGGENWQGGMTVTLPCSGEQFGVPNNLHIIGTMNTADRSIAMIDIALRRRFEFVEMMPKPELLSKSVGGVNLQTLLGTINDRIEYLYDRDHVIGHAYFMDVGDDLKKLRDVFIRKVIPLLQEYFYGDWEKICIVLGCPYSLATGKDPECKNQKPIITAERLSLKRISGITSKDYEDRLKYEVNDGFKGAEGDLAQYFTAIYQ